MAFVDTFAIRRVRPYLRGTARPAFRVLREPRLRRRHSWWCRTRTSTPGSRRRSSCGSARPRRPSAWSGCMPVADLLFFERALPSELAPNRDIGVQVLGELPAAWSATRPASINGVPDGVSGDLDTNDGKDLAARIVVRPFVHDAQQPAEWPDGRDCRARPETSRAARRRSGRHRLRRHFVDLRGATRRRPAATAYSPAGLLLLQARGRSPSTSTPQTSWR